VPREPIEAITLKQMPPTFKENMNDEYKVPDDDDAFYYLCGYLSLLMPYWLLSTFHM
jgi:hypothetical protein